MATVVLKLKTAVKLLIENNWTLLDGNYLGCLQIISCPDAMRGKLTGVQEICLDVHLIRRGLAKSFLREPP